MLPSYQSYLLQLLIRKLNIEKEQLSKVLEMEKSRAMQLEIVLRERGLFQSGSAVQLGAESKTVAERMALLEMKEIHERQRAEHAVAMQQHMKEQLEQSLQRVIQLEDSVQKLTSTSLELQQTEQKLRDALNGLELPLSFFSLEFPYRECAL